MGSFVVGLVWVCGVRSDLVFGCMSLCFDVDWCVIWVLWVVVL